MSVEMLKFSPSGDSAVTVELGDSINEATANRVRLLDRAVSSFGDIIIETIPTYRSLTVIYRPEAIDYDTLCEKIRATDLSADNNQSTAPLIYVIPVCYGGEFGPDLDFIAEHSGLSVDEVVSIHSGTDYLIYMLGFTPGYPYMGGMDERLVTPRLSTPRTLIPAGSVAIGGAQTGIYPVGSPGGWRIIGRTPLNLYTPTVTPPVLLDAGNYVRFKPISEQEYQKLLLDIKEERYTPTVFERSATDGH